MESEIEMPTECNSCGELFDLKPYLKEGDDDKPIREVIDGIFEDGDAMCGKCDGK